VTAPDVMAVVVTHNSRDAIGAFATATLSELGDRDALVVVDNASSDDTVHRVHAMLPTATVLEPGRNLGYGAAVNLAFAAVRPRDAMLVTNPDALLHPGALRRLHAGVRPGVGIAVPRLVAPDGSLARSLRREPTILRAAGEAVLGGLRAGRVAALGEIVCDSADYTEPHTADWATGAAWLVSAECFDAVGGFAEDYFLYSEETDFALRARDRGFATAYVPDAVVTHEGGTSNVDPALFALLTRNRVRCYRRRHRAPATLAFRMTLLAGELARAGAGRATSRAAVRALLGDDRVLPPAAVRNRYGTRRRGGHRGGGPSGEGAFGTIAA
jgi:N-acetylglucosaminyl-diphospho-decaprenol L-rhamnosyltransferase